jgi:cytoskeletal protein CcmA (bactofilin family)
MENRGSVEQTVITEDVEVVGTIKATNGLRMDGRLNGDLNCSSDVEIGKSASIKGNISVNCATVQGQINGNLVAKDRVELKAAARINGDVKAKRLSVEDGVSFVGKVEVNPSGVAAGNRPQVADSSSHEKSENASADNVEGSGEKSRGLASFIGRK